MTKEAQIIETRKNRKVDTIDTAQLEYTAWSLFEYGSISVALVAFWAAIIYMGVQQLKK